MATVPGVVPVMPSTVRSKSGAPVPQLAPIASGGIEAEGRAERRALVGGGFGDGAELLDRGYGLGPDDIRAAIHQGRDLLLEGIDRVGVGESPDRFEDFTGGPDRARHDHRAAASVRAFAGKPGGGHVQFAHPPLRVV